MYRNCVYDNKTRSVHLWTWDSNGNRVFEQVPFNPYLFLEDKTGNYKSIFGTLLKKREFETGWDRNKFVKNSGIKRLFENLPPYQQFLIDNFWNSAYDDSFSQYPLKIMFFDLECPGEIGGQFSDAEKAENPINLMTCYDNFSRRFNVFGLKPYHTVRDDVIYHHCKSEEDLLKRFLKFFKSDYPDVLSTYNGASFDIPYLINRINLVLGERKSDVLSPLERIYEKMNMDGKFGMPSKEYVIEGISCVDYYILYQKFALNKLESYKLDYVAEYELGENKVAYNGSLAELATKDWYTYVDYNIQDVEILVKLDDTLRYIELLRFISYLGLCNMENAIKTVPVINGAVAIRARYRDERIPTFIRPKVEGKIPGGYVAEPKLGFSDNVISFDANSLYPSVMISLNLSPETKVGRVEKVDNIYNLYHVSGKKLELTRDNFKKMIVNEKLSLTKANFLFSQKKMGLMPEFLDFLYSKRKEMKKKMLEIKKKSKSKNLSESDKFSLEKTIQKLDTFQHAYKITLNSTYGYCANKYAPLGDDDIGSSVTLTGQAVIKKSNDLFKKFVEEFYPNLSSKVDEALIYNDTDSIYLSLKMFENYSIFLKDKNSNKISKEFIELCDNFENYLNTNMTKWAKNELLSADPRFVFKREVISDKMMFIGGKNYVLHVLNNEGVDMDEFKYKGVSVVTTKIPKAIKPYLKDIIETMVMTQSLSQTNELYLKCYDIFKDLGPNKTYKNSSVNNYEKYKRLCNNFEAGKGVPGHVLAAHYYDLVIEDLKLTSKYTKFKSGDKVKMHYLKTPNKYGIDRIGFKDTFPEEFNGILEVDYETMFDKIVYSSLKKFFEVVNWVLRKPNNNVKVELEEFFKDL